VPEICLPTALHTKVSIATKVERAPQSLLCAAPRRPHGTSTGCPAPRVLFWAISHAPGVRVTLRDEGLLLKDDWSLRTSIRRAQVFWYRSMYPLASLRSPMNEVTGETPPAFTSGEERDHTFVTNKGCHTPSLNRNANDQRSIDAWFAVIRLPR
jgi:hypothetical protein